MTTWLLTSFFTVIMRSIKLGIVIWKLDTCYHKVILLVRSVCPKYQPVHTVVLPLGSANRKRRMITT